MPELPDVQVFSEYLGEHALDRTIETVSVRAGGMLEEVSEGTLRAALRGHDLVETRRHGEHLFARSGEERGEEEGLGPDPSAPASACGTSGRRSMDGRGR